MCVHAELKGSAYFPAPGEPFRLDARADRIDRLADGRVAIVDIKTGSPPAKTAMEDGREPQMPLEAAIMRHGGFDALVDLETAELAIWRVGGQAAGKIVEISGDKAAAAADLAWANLQRIVFAYDDVTIPYLSEPRGAAGYSDYRGLARLSDEVEESA